MRDTRSCSEEIASFFYISKAFVSVCIQVEILDILAFNNDLLAYFSYEDDCLLGCCAV
jgi:hypothetical protein